MNDVRRDLNGRAFCNNPSRENELIRLLYIGAKGSYIVEPSALPPLPIAGARCKPDGTGGWSRRASFLKDVDFQSTWFMEGTRA